MGQGDSDLLTVYNAYLAWKRVCLSNGSEYQFCRKNFLSQQTLTNIEDLKGQLVVCLVDSGFLPLTEAERNVLNKYVFQNTPSVWLACANKLGLDTLPNDDNSSTFRSEPTSTVTMTQSLLR